MSPSRAHAINRCHDRNRPTRLDCDKNLAAVGTTDAAVANASLNTTILNGDATLTNYAQDVYGNSPHPWRKLSGNNIYTDASWVNGMNTQQQESMLLLSIM